MVVFFVYLFMKNFITIISIFMSSVLFGQNLDSLTFNYINQYRVKSGRKALVWSDELYKTCIKHSDNMIMNDSTYHSHGYVYSENVSYGKNCTFSFDEKYKNFIKKYFNLTYEEVIKNINVYCATESVYSWYNSKKHNEIMLSDKKYGSVRIVLKDIIKKNNIVFGREVFKGVGPFYYKVTVAETFQIK